MSNRTNDMSQDTELTDHVTRILDQSVEQLDPEVMDELQQRRKQALHAGQRNRSQPLLIAASLAAFLILPWMMLTSGKDTQGLSPGTAPDLSSATEATFVTDPDFLNNWEMLDAIGEELHGS